MTAAVQLSAKSVEHYGPPELGTSAHYILGGVDLDPASCPAANRLIRATRYYTKEDDGLAQPWSGRVYLNPPGGRVKVGGEDYNSAAFWWWRLVSQWLTGEVASAMFVMFNLETLRYAQAHPCPHPLRFPHVFPTERLDFYAPNPEDPDGDPLPQGQPGHPNAVILLPGQTGEADRFVQVFQRWGIVFPGSAPYERT